MSKEEQQDFIKFITPKPETKQLEKLKEEHNKIMARAKQNKEMAIETNVEVPVKKTNTRKNTANSTPIELVIEKKIPMPTGQARNAFTNIAPKLKIGDSVFVKDLPKTRYVTAKKLGITLATRKMDDGFRIWRIA